jgi:hypothetical protein
MNMSSAARAQSLALWGRLEQPQTFGNQRERELQAMDAGAMDACGNLNATVIGDWEHPKVRHQDRGVPVTWGLSAGERSISCATGVNARS